MSDSVFRLDSHSDSDSELGAPKILDNLNVDTSTTPPDSEPPQISLSLSSNSDVDTDTDYVIIPSPVPLQIPLSSTSSFISDPEYLDLGSTSMTTPTTANNINTNLYRGHAAWEAMERPAADATRHKRGARQHHHKHRRHRHHHARDRTNDVPFSRDVVLLLGLCLILACVLIISIRPLALAWLDNS